MNETTEEGKCSALSFVATSATFRKGQGIYLWDVDGKRYYDFVSAFSAGNLGHCHPKVVEAVKKQVDILTLTSRAFFSDALDEFAQFVTNLFGYDKVIPLNSGVQACEAAIKVARKWGYLKKKIPENQAKVVFAEGNYCGQSITVLSVSAYTICTQYVGPFMPGFIIIPYNDLAALEKTLKEDPNICAFMVEPIQGEAGIIPPSKGYLKGVRELCTKYNVLWIDDEIQAGLGRAGKLLVAEYENVRPDIVCLGKSLSGGIMPVSAVLADESIMLTMTPGEHASTYGANPLGCRAAIAALKVLIDERLGENALRLEPVLRRELERLPKTIVKEVRGVGLMYAIVLKDGLSFTARDVCMKLSDNGLLTKYIGKDVVRFSPPLIITEEQLLEGTSIIFNTFNSYCD